MDDYNIPIFKITYNLYKDIYSTRLSVPKQDRYTLWQRVENIHLDIFEGILHASELNRQEKLPVLHAISVKLNLLRMLIRMARDNKVITDKKYVFLQQQIDEIGRMLGGWIKWTQDESKTPLSRDVCT